MGIGEADYRSLAEFRYVLRCFARFSEGAAREVGLTARQHQVLLAIRGWPQTSPMTIAGLAERLQLKHNSAVGLVDRLVRAGLVRRTTVRDDRRQVEIRLTAKGTRLLHSLTNAHKQELKRIAPQLLTSLNGVLRRQTKSRIPVAGHKAPRAAR